MSAAEEIVEGELVPYEAAPTPVSLFGTNDPGEVVQAAKRAAEPLVDVIRSQKLYVKIGQSEHVRVEGWTLLGSMLGVFPVCVWTRKVEGDDPGWEARVEARTRTGEVVGAAEAECLRSESTWKNRDDYALKSMAQTRATSKALRQPLGFVMQLAGFNPTPAEEMPVPERKPRATNKDKATAMRARIMELAGEADQLRGETKTLGEIEATSQKTWDKPLADLSEPQLQILGTDLKQWLDGGAKNDFQVIPFVYFEPSEMGIWVDPWRPR